jgi:hypothetical protein
MFSVSCENGGQDFLAKKGPAGRVFAAPQHQKNLLPVLRSRSSPQEKLLRLANPEVEFPVLVGAPATGTIGYTVFTVGVAV